MAGTTSNIYEFRIKLIEHRPRIWRLIQVPDYYNFWDLHVAIQEAMGWNNCHMHQFQIKNPITKKLDLIGIPDDDGFSLDTISEKTVKIAKYFLHPKNIASYEYDFGDRWKHNIILVKILPAVGGILYPQCLEGKLTCPPENCGGVQGYKNLLEIMKNPQHRGYRERMEWLNMIGRGDFNQKDFNPKLIKFSNSIVLAPPGPYIYQFKIILRGYTPNIWRRIQVPKYYTFWDLHVAIQDAMGWEDTRLHQFEMTNPMTEELDVIGIPLIPDELDGTAFELEPTGTVVSEKAAKIANYFESPSDKALYEYDFGDVWQHLVVLEKISEAIVGIQYPQCLDGRMACPPEFVRGVAGYRKFLKILSNPQHKEYKKNVEMLVATGRLNQPNFNPKLVKFDNPNERWIMAFN